MDENLPVSPPDCASVGMQSNLDYAPANLPPPKLEYASALGGENLPIATFPDSGEAHLVAIVLEEQGVRASIAETRPALDFGRLPGTLLVREADVARAIELLAAIPQARKWLTVPDSQVPPMRVLKLDTCPNCESTDVRRSSTVLRVAMVMFALAWMPMVLNYGIAIYAALVAGWISLVLQTPRWRCRQCRYRWS